MSAGSDVFRIVSLCPSSTVSIIELGLEESLVGRTKYCIHPSKLVQQYPMVGGTKNPNVDLIADLKPTHILFNMEENKEEYLEVFRKMAEVVVTTPVDIDTTKEMLRTFGEVFNVEEAAEIYTGKIEELSRELQLKAKDSFRYLYFIWNKPMIVVGRNTYIDSMLSLTGGVNVAADISTDRYPNLTGEQIQALCADVALLSSEPFSYKAEHLEKYAFAAKEVKLIDGEMLSWHGTYTVRGLEYIKKYFEIV